MAGYGLFTGLAYHYNSNLLRDPNQTSRIPDDLLLRVTCRQLAEVLPSNKAPQSHGTALGPRDVTYTSSSYIQALPPFLQRTAIVFRNLYKPDIIVVDEVATVCENRTFSQNKLVDDATHRAKLACPDKVVVRVLPWKVEMINLRILRNH